MSPHRSLLALVPSSEEGRLRAAADELGLTLRLAPSISALFEELEGDRWTATLLSLSGGPVDEEVARRVGHEQGSGTLLLSAPGASLQRALVTERTGAVALLREPLESGTLRAQIAAILDQGAEVPIPEESEPTDEGPAIVGSGPDMAEIFQVVARVADTSATVLLTGESGTGKELVARAIHWASDRREGPFVAVNCAAIPEHLLESELFGHERGAFTGAVARKEGRFQRADGGTLLLDEIGDMGLVLQAKILRALEEKVVERVGGEEPISLDARVIAATNRSLERAIAEGEFREDLYYRLAVVELRIPPLRERPGDIRELALHFAGRFARRHGRPVRAVTEEALERLEAHSWPGNVRELRNVMDRAVVLTRGPVLRSGDLRIGAGSPRGS
ncbi:MAG TPA: sigma-54 dependent transcriptional regulator, partial [Longimicrobiales bacterium]|nr:sigma-54 dependent transcriptional regulator [Longimicrobiales bacterium]